MQCFLVKQKAPKGISLERHLVKGLYLVLSRAWDLEEACLSAPIIADGL